MVSSCKVIQKTIIKYKIDFKNYFFPFQYPAQYSNISAVMPEELPVNIDYSGLHYETVNVQGTLVYMRTFSDNNQILTSCHFTAAAAFVSLRHCSKGPLNSQTVGGNGGFQAIKKKKKPHIKLYLREIGSYMYIIIVTGYSRYVRYHLSIQVVMIRCHQ